MNGIWYMISFITTIRYDAHNGVESCADADAAKTLANKVAYTTGLYATYESERPHNEDSVKASEALDEIAQGLKKRYNSGEKINKEMQHFPNITICTKGINRI